MFQRFSNIGSNCERSLKPRSSTEKSVKFTDDVSIDNSSPLSLSPRKISIIKSELETVFTEMEKNISPIVRVIAPGEELFESSVIPETEMKFSTFQTLWLSPEETKEGTRRESLLVHIGRPGRTPATRLVRHGDSSDVITTLDPAESSKVEHVHPNSEESSFNECRE